MDAMHKQISRFVQKTECLDSHGVVTAEVAFDVVHYSALELIVE